MGISSTMGMIQVVTVCTFLPTVPYLTQIFHDVDIRDRDSGTADDGNSEGVVGVRNGRRFGTFVFLNADCRTTLTENYPVCNASRDCRSCVVSQVHTYVYISHLRSLVGVTICTKSLIGR